MVEAIEAGILGDQDKWRRPMVVRATSGQVLVIGPDQKADEQKTNDIEAVFTVSAGARTSLEIKGNFDDCY